MGNKDGFKIENGVLTGYAGADADVTVPEGVEMLGGDAFRFRADIRRVVLPKSLRRIEAEAFWGCSALEEIVFPENLSSIGAGAFSGTPWLEKQTKGCLYLGKVLYKYIGEMPPGTELMIRPGTCAVAGGALRDCAGLRAVTFPDSLREIGSWAFQGCVSLREIRLPSGLTELGAGAFCGCEHLARAVLPETLHAVGRRTFKDCAALRELVVSPALTDWGESALRGCRALADGSGFVTASGILFDYVGAGGEVAVPEGVDTIGESAFCDNAAVTALRFPASLKTIGSRAFERCASLRSAPLPEGLTEIGAEAFHLCRSLTAVAIPDGCTAVEPYAFMGCASLQTLTLGKGLRSIDSHAFMGCEALERVDFPDGLESIGSSAFQKCRSLTELYLPDSLQRLGSAAFGDCSGLRHLRVPPTCMDAPDETWLISRFPNVELFDLWLTGNTDFDTRVDRSFTAAILRRRDEYASDIMRRDIGAAMDGLLRLLETPPLSVIERYLSESLRLGCREVTAQLLAWQRTHFDEQTLQRAQDERVDKELGLLEYSEEEQLALFRCTEEDGALRILEYRGMDSLVTVPAHIGDKPVRSFCLSRSERGVTGNLQHVAPVSDVVIEPGVERIGDYAFQRCGALCGVTIPESVREIGAYAFSMCRSLAALRLPDALENLGDGAFSDCAALAEMEIPEGVKRIGQLTFKNCAGLRSLHVPRSVEYIWPNAFEGCGRLTLSGEKGSYAERFALENGFPFEAG